MFDRRMVKMMGLNGRMLAIDSAHVLFLEEHSLDGKLCTNVHFTNGKWITSGLSLDQAEALLSDKEYKESEERRKRWSDSAREQAQYKGEIDAIVRQLVVDQKPTTTKKEMNPDGSFRYVLEFPAQSKSESDT